MCSSDLPSYEWNSWSLPCSSSSPSISCPLLGLFGKDDKSPSPEHVAEIDRLLDEHGKDHEFHSYDGAGHAFFSVDRPAYRAEAAIDGWDKIFGFLAQHVGS